jgi:uncharacterized membrane protein YedE/YeeE
MSNQGTCGRRCRVISLVLAGVAGTVFGGGLLLSGMTQPAKVVAFLDPTGGWDPSLAFVMAGAATVYALLFRSIRRRRSEPWLDVAFHLPTRRDLDAPLILGAGVFGIGWGLGGFCPGPGIVAAASGSITGIVFVAAMLAGMYAHHRTSRA